MALLAAFSLPAEALAADFPAVHYQAGTITAGTGDQKVLDRQVLDFYSAWKTVYVQHGCGDGTRLCRDQRRWQDRPGAVRRTKDHHGFGSPWLWHADHRHACRRRSGGESLFDGYACAIFLDHPADSDPGLMAWNQVESCADAGDDVGGSNSATDGDLDIGYALLLADSKWGSEGEFDYRALARADHRRRARPRSLPTPAISFRSATG